MNKKNLGFSTRAIHAGQEPDPSSGAIMTPIYLSSTFVQSSPGVHQGYDYTRAGNPTRQAYEDCFASLENGTKAFAFASGCSATATVIHLLNSGDHVIAGDDMYGGTYRLFEKVMSNKGIQFSYVDLTNPEKTLEQAMQNNTKLIWIETPTNPTLKLTPIKKISEMAHSKGIKVAVDNTFMSPYFQKPLDLGADFSVHSTTKYVGGHSDVLGGMIIVKDEELAESVFFQQLSVGAVSSPFDSYMAMRSLKTLSIRMEAHQKKCDESG